MSFLGARYWIVGFEWEIWRSFAGGLFAEFEGPARITFWDGNFEARIRFCVCVVDAGHERAFFAFYFNKGRCWCGDVGL